MPGIFTTREAAAILGVSVTQVQHLVEHGILEGWKTRGGHRRIPIAALEAHMAKSHRHPVDQGTATLNLMVVEDDEMQRELYRIQLGKWNLPLDVSLCSNGYQALIEMASKRPDIMLVDIVMQGMDGLELVRAVRGNAVYSDVDIAILTQKSLAELEERGVPAGVAYFSKPIDFSELRGYLRAHCARKAKLMGNPVAPV
jgi:excisionase family DNA binding protein